MSVEEGKKAPDFTAATDGGKKLKLSELREIGRASCRERVFRVV